MSIGSLVSGAVEKAKHLTAAEPIFAITEENLIDTFKKVVGRSPAPEEMPKLREALQNNPTLTKAVNDAVIAVATAFQFNQHQQPAQ